jgi:hypothetical protein
MFYGKAITQSVFRRFMVSPFQWTLFNDKRVEKFQEDQTTRLENGDVIAVDDTLVSHDHAKKMPFLYLCFLEEKRTRLHAFFR